MVVRLQNQTFITGSNVCRKCNKTFKYTLMPDTLAFMVENNKALNRCGNCQAENRMASIILDSLYEEVSDDV